MPDHVHMLPSIPPRYSLAQVVGRIKGKSALHIARTFSGDKKNFTSQHEKKQVHAQCNVSFMNNPESQCQGYLRDCK